MVMRDRATDPSSSEPPTGRMACAEAPGVLRAQGHVRWMRGTGHAAGRWTERMRRGRTAVSPLCHDFNSVRLYACSALAGLERLPADLCRPLGAVSTRPSALPDGVLRWPGGQEACVRQPRENGVHRVPLLAVWSGQARGGDELSILVVLTVCQSLRRSLGHPGEHDAP